MRQLGARGQELGTISFHLNEKPTHLFSQGYIRSQLFGGSPEIAKIIHEYANVFLETKATCRFH